MATIVSLHAHPDDETLLSGGWIAQRAAAGDRVVLAYGTDGRAGLADARYPSTALDQVRRREAEAAAAVLGAQRVVWLGYEDSGMAGRPSRTPARFVEATVDEVARRVAALLDEERADILTGYDANGGYGHPDHLQVHRVARRAQELARARPLLLEATLDRSRLLVVLRLLRLVSRLLPGLTVPSPDVFSGRRAISTVVDVRPQLPTKRAALAAHASQTTGGVRTIRLLLALPPALARRVLGTEWFVEVF